MKKLGKTRFWKSQLEGPGGMKVLLPIAMPMVLTSLFDTMMTFIDRVYLSFIGKEHIAACMMGSVAAWLCITLMVGFIGYSSAVIAHYFGAKRYTECPKVVYQTLLLAFASYPLVLLIGCFGCKLLGGKGHDPYQVELEKIYFLYMIVGSIFTLMRASLVSFFAGVGKTGIVMKANAIALVVNLIANYLLIFGKLGLPRMEIHGAAIGTILASLSMVLVLLVRFFREYKKKPFYGKFTTRPEFDKIKLLVRYGLPNGLENMITTACFTLSLAILHSYGADVATAVTIVFNWDNVSFMPIIGLQTGVVALVGRYMGAAKPKLAERAACSGYKLVFIYSSCTMLLFCLIPHLLISVFTPGGDGLDYSMVRYYAVPMLRFAALYLMSDGVYLVATGALRGAGDSIWVMITGILLHLLFTGTLLYAVKIMQTEPVTAWLMFCIAVMIGGIVMVIRFLKGKWKTIDMLANKQKIMDDPIISE